MTLSDILDQELSISNSQITNRSEACPQDVSRFHMNRSRGGLTNRDKRLLLGAGLDEIDSNQNESKIRYELRLRCINTILDLALISHRLTDVDFQKVVTDVQKTDYDVSTELISMLYRACDRVGANFEQDLAKGIEAAKNREGDGKYEITVSITETKETTNRY